jgi:peptidyl-prolyl cis-trans isomerase C
MLKFRIRTLAAVAIAAGAGLLPAQKAPAPAGQAPAAEHPTAALPAPPAPHQAGPDDVVATIEGEKFTPARIKQLREGLPPQFQQVANRMNDKAFLRSYAELLVMSRRAEESKMPEQEPYKSQLDFLRMNFLAQAYLQHLDRQIKPSQNDFQRYYDEHKADYEEAHVRTLYVAFSPNAGKPGATGPNGKRLLTEAEAKSKAERLAAELKQGGDFAQAAKQQSDDTATAEKGGDLGPVKRGSTGIPAELKQVIFALKPGEVSEPIRQPAGFYIFKLESMRTPPLAEVLPTLNQAVRGVKLREELDQITKSIHITYNDETFFDPAEPGSAKPATPAVPKALAPRAAPESK